MRIPGRVPSPHRDLMDALSVGKPEVGVEQGIGIAEAASSLESKLVEFCDGLGYELNVVDSIKGIPAINREFDEALHAGDQIWVVSSKVDIGFVWHEVGHCFAAECRGPGMDRGLHWCFGTWEGDEGEACAAAGAIMEHFEVPQKIQDKVNEYVHHFPHEDSDEGLQHAEEQRRWGEILKLWLETKDIDRCRSMYRKRIGV